MDSQSSFRKFVAYILLLSCFNLFTACQRFYRPVKVEASGADARQASLKTLSGDGRYFILRQGANSYSLNNVTIDQSGMTLTSDIKAVPEDHQLYIEDLKQRFKYSKSKNQQVVLKEVHLYTANRQPIDSNQRYTLPLSEIDRIEVIQHDKSRTSTSYIIGGLALTLGAAIVVALVAVATAPQPEPVNIPPGSSCPYVSAYDGEKFVLQGEVYGGAIFPQLQRDDYLPLDAALTDNNYILKLSNELQEVQHTDFADVLVVEHDPEQQVMVDPDGKIHSVSQRVSIDQAMLNGQMDVKEQLAAKDRQSCLFNDLGNRGDRESLYLTFKNINHSAKAKLIMNLRSSPWFDHLYGNFTRAFGNSYNSWIREQAKEPAAKMEAWMNEQSIPLVISVKTEDGWQEVRKLNTIGPLLNREVIIPLNIPASETAEIRLSCGYMFWELDYAAIDYTNDAAFEIERLKPYEAINEKQVDVLLSILNADKKFLDQPAVGDATILKYRGKKARTGKTQSVFLHTSGHYEHVRVYKGSPKTAFLKSFSKPGALAAFSKQEFLKSWNKLADVSVR